MTELMPKSSYNGAVPVALAEELPGKHDRVVARPAGKKKKKKKKGGSA